MKRLITTAAAMISAALLVASFAAPASAKPAKPDKPEQATSQTELKNAAKECKAERRENPGAFTATYGTGKNGRNALGKCVSQKVETAETTPSA